jgi:hypothetical protein
MVTICPENGALESLGLRVMSGGADFHVDHQRRHLACEAGKPRLTGQRNCVGTSQQGQQTLKQGRQQCVNRLSITTTRNTTLPAGMPWRTPIDGVFNQRFLFYAFVGIIVGTTAVTLFSDSIIGSSSLKGTGLDSENQGTISLPSLGDHSFSF